MSDMSAMDARSIKALSCADAWPHPVHGVELIETHISWVFLTGEYAYKIKKPVDFGFLDFSSLDKRRRCCEEEVRLNRRLAPDLYLDVVPITGSAAEPRVAGPGDAIDYAVKMRQFDTDAEFDRLLARGELGPEHVDQVASTLARFHQGCDVAAPDSGFGTADAVSWPVRENFDQVRPHLRNQLGDDAWLQFIDLEQWSLEACERLGDSFERRLRKGFVRECHGDLHLRNIVVVNGEVTPFDCIEFNPKLRWIDVISELAFLLMDLDDHGRSDLSGRLVNAYLEFTGDYEGLELLRFYQVYRAMVRVKVECLRLAQVDNADSRLMAEMQRYLDLAGRYTSVHRPGLLITHGLSGSGKTYLSQKLLEAAPVIRVRSDVERKRIYGLSPLESSRDKLEEGIYTRIANDRTYARLESVSSQLIGDGFDVIVDAAFLLREERDQFRRLAQVLGAPFAIVHCEMEPEIQRERVASRSERADDASEAGLLVLERQARFEEPLGGEERAYTVVVDTTDALDLRPLLDVLGG